MLERRSIPSGGVARRLNGVTIRPARALPFGRLDARKREDTISRALSWTITLHDTCPYFAVVLLRDKSPTTGLR